MLTIRPAILALSIVLGTVASTSTAGAQVAVGIRGSTLGAGVEVSIRPARMLGLRATGNFLTFTREDEVEGIPYELEPRLRSGGVNVDFYPFGKALDLSGGLLLNGNEASAEAIIGESITIGNRTYSNTEIQSLRGDLEWSRSLAPHVGLGFESGGRVGLVVEAGVVFTGTPTVSLSGTTTLTGPERQFFDEAVAQEEAQVRAWIDDNRRWTKYHPVVALGLRIRF
ncbi:MAG TPA: hypothetical protein VMK53_09780 [Gemmatimonadales bacterium]|nr:hypothetical protein [Gemmatimonadales bacterium]